jgi:outer membrane protein TolC
MESKVLTPHPPLRWRGSDSRLKSVRKKISYASSKSLRNLSPCTPLSSGEGPGVRPILAFILTLAFTHSSAQQDSSKYFSIEQYYAAILANHPIAKQAALLSETAQQEIRLAKGNFDPKLEAVYSTKAFQDKSYYSMADAYLSVPTRSPLTPKIGFEQNEGELLNEIDKIPGNKQFLAGLSVPIGRGLITDERRTTLKQAELLTTLAEAEQIKLINKLLLEAAKEYWSWYYAHESYQLLTQGAHVASEIFRRVKLNQLNGEASALDTVQAKITLQTRLVEKQESFLELQNSIIRLSNFLWDDAQNPIQISQNARPVISTMQTAIGSVEAESLLTQASENHPELIKQTIKINQLEYDKKLAREFLKPRLDLNYSLLSQPYTTAVFDPLNDYKLDVNFSMSLFLRKERSKVALTDIKIKTASWERTQQQRDILNEVSAALNEVNNMALIIQQQQSMVNSYERLMQGELLNLENGESDLFKINVQQEKLIQSQLKLVKLKSTLEKQRAYVYWAAGSKNLNDVP